MSQSVCFLFTSVGDATTEHVAKTCSASRLFLPPLSREALLAVALGSSLLSLLLQPWQAIGCTPLLTQERTFAALLESILCGTPPIEWFVVSQQAPSCGTSSCLCVHVKELQCRKCVPAFRLTSCSNTQRQICRCHYDF